MDKTTHSYCIGGSSKFTLFVLVRTLHLSTDRNTGWSERGTQTSKEGYNPGLTHRLGWKMIPSEPRR